MDKITEQYLMGFFIFNIQIGRFYTFARFLNTLARNPEVGANSLSVYDERYLRLILASTIKLSKNEKAQKVWAFCIEKVPTNCIIS